MITTAGCRLGGLLPSFEQGNRLSANHEQAVRNRQIVRMYLDSAGIDDVDQITTGSIKAYLAGLVKAGKSPATIRNHRCAVSVFCQWLADESGQLVGNPAAKVAVPKIETKLPNYLDEDEIAQALAIARASGIYAEVAVAIHCGLRVAEIARLRWADVDLPRRRVLVYKAKSKRPRAVPLNDVAAAALAEQRSGPDGRFEYVFPGGRAGGGGGTWTRHQKRGRDWWIRKALQPLKAAMPKFRVAPIGRVGTGWHLFRHTFGSMLAQQGASAVLIQNWMGHTSRASTDIYMHLAPVYNSTIEVMPGCRGWRSAGDMTVTANYPNDPGGRTHAEASMPRSVEAAAGLPAAAGRAIMEPEYQI